MKYSRSLKYSKHINIGFEVFIVICFTLFYMFGCRRHEALALKSAPCFRYTVQYIQTHRLTHLQIPQPHRSTDPQTYRPIDPQTTHRPRDLCNSATAGPAVSFPAGPWFPLARVSAHAVVRAWRCFPLSRARRWSVLPAGWGATAVPCLPLGSGGRRRRTPRWNVDPCLPRCPLGTCGHMPRAWSLVRAGTGVRPRRGAQNGARVAI